MATSTDIQPPASGETPPARRGFSTAEGRPRPTSGAELWWWLFMRISGILLLFLAIGHVLLMHVVGDGIDRVNFAFVQLRWQYPFWRTWDWLLLSLALVHGVNGLRAIVQDYVRKPQARFAINWFFYIVGFVIFSIGTIVVLTFDPSAWPIPGVTR
jgi:succinate dehydrogenase / fumarate reductase membrane anchor subunit